MAIADALSLSYIMLNVMCQVLSLVMLGRTSTDIGRHTELTYFRWLLITFVLYCVADSVPVLSQVGFITPQARLFALELSIVLISFMAYLCTSSPRRTSCRRSVPPRSWGCWRPCPSFS